ncbi:ImmA/IrrE family metallo-endopeptidase [Candidatus Parcubacteria bacterium]|nr:ImmA/IrrE family metallo-endopeptidase [Candidatus Parcubacteria bacterium]
MDYKEFKAPFISNEDIKGQADLFRKKYWGDIIPVEIEIIIEGKLAIEIIPVPGLKRQCNADAFISSDWKSVSVDNEKYMDESYYNRLRFSIAHEIGHLALHKNLYKDLKICSLDDFRSFQNDVPGNQYGYIETQANKFASYFLIPRNKLAKERALIIRAYDEIADYDINLINSYIATPLGKKFGVSAEAMEIALK